MPPAGLRRAAPLTAIALLMLGAPLGKGMGSDAAGVGWGGMGAEEGEGPIRGA